MGIKYSFVDSVVYGTEDVNDITRSIVGAGVAPFISKDSYNVSDLNAMTAALVEAGAQLDGCKCTAKNNGTVEMSIDISQGIVFFESGVRLEIDEEGYNIGVEPNVEGYVVANYNAALQKADIVFATSLPEDGENIILAKVLQNGTVSNLKSFAKSKIASVGKNVMLKLPFEKLSQPVLYDNRYIIAKVSGIDLSRFNFAFLVENYVTGSELDYFPNLGYNAVVYNLNEAKTEYVIRQGKTLDGEVKYFQYYAQEYIYYLEKINGEMCIVCACSEKNKNNALNHIDDCTICFL